MDEGVVGWVVVVDMVIKKYARCSNGLRHFLLPQRTKQVPSKFTRDYSVNSSFLGYIPLDSPMR